jgi:hypothetical protein
LRFVRLGGHLVVLAATLGSGFLVGTGAFDVTTTNFTMVKDKVLLPYITLLALSCLPATAYNTAALTETPRPFAPIKTRKIVSKVAIVSVLL